MVHVCTNISISYLHHQAEEAAQAFNKLAFEPSEIESIRLRNAIELAERIAKGDSGTAVYDRHHCP